MASTTKPFFTKLVSPTRLQRRAPTGSPPSFLWKFGKQHAYSYAAGTYLDNAYHPLYDVSRKRWEAKKEPLWLSVMALKTNGESSRCVRSWLARRLRISLKESLRKEGYSWDGNPLPGSARHQPLTGTAQFFAVKPMTKLSPERLQEQSDRVVKEIIRLQARKEKGSLPRTGLEKGVKGNDRGPRSKPLDRTMVQRPK